MSDDRMFRARVGGRARADLVAVDGVRLEGDHLLCSALGLFDLRRRGGTLFVADGGAVLVDPGHGMLLFQEGPAG